MTFASFITGLLAIEIALRILIGSTILNQYVGYTSGTGFVGGRFHPATYMLAGTVLTYVLGLMLLPMTVRPRGTRFLVALAFSGAAVALALANGGQNAAAVVLDVIIAPLVMAFLLSQLDDARRELLFRVILWLVVLNLVPVVFEKATGIALVPRDKTYREAFFRPQGYLDHPLVAGGAILSTMWALLRIGRRPAVDLALSGALLLQMLFLSVRLPLVVAAGLFTLQILKLGRRSDTGKVAAAFFLIVIPPALFTIAVASGLLDRFQALGLYDDQSSASRVIAFNMMGDLSYSQLWSGVSNEQLAAMLTNYHIGGIENSFVAYTLLGGLGVAILVFVAILVAILPVLRRDFVFAVLTLALFLGTISFSIKAASCMIYLLFSAIVAERRADERYASRAGRAATAARTPSVFIEEN